MDNLTSMSIEGTGIEELPPSFGNLVGLQELSMTSCLTLKELPDNIDMLQNLRNLDIEGCPQLRNFLTKLREMEHTLTFSNIQSLNLENCGLIDEDLPIIFNCFPELAVLVLSGNNFVALPSCMDQFSALELLHLDNCKQLQEIPGIPPNLQYINAMNCTSLTVESSNLLLSQETFEACELQVVVPGTRLPEWFDHLTKGEYMTFWVCKMIPPIILCYALEVESEMNENFYCQIQFYINGDEVYEFETPISFPEMLTDHVWLCDLRTLPSIQWHSLDLMDGWNQVEISCNMISGAPNVTVGWCGVHVCRQEEANYILFTDPNPDLDSSIHSEKIDTDLDTNTEGSTMSIEDVKYCKNVDDNCYNFNSFEGSEQPDRKNEEGLKINDHREYNVTTCHTDLNHCQDNNLLHHKTLDCVTKDSMTSLCLGDIGSAKASTSDTVVAGHPVKAQPPSGAVSSNKVTNSNSTIVLPTTIDLLRNQTYSTINDEEMEAFYAILDAETSFVSLSNDNKMDSKLANRIPSEETKKALKTLQYFLTKDFSVLLSPSEYSIMKDTLDYLTNLPAEEGVSVEIRSLIIEMSIQFTYWSWNYTSENKKIEFTTAKLLKANELEEVLEANKTHFKEIMSLENELCNELAYLEERKKELEEQIKAVKANISASQAARNVAIHRKRELFGEAMILKAQRDELREQVPHLKDEQELAKKIQANIRAEWSKLGEKFSNSLRN